MPIYAACTNHMNMFAAATFVNKFCRAIAIDAIVTCFRPCFVEIIEGGALLILIGQKPVSRRPMGRMRHEIK